MTHALRYRGISYVKVIADSEKDAEKLDDLYISLARMKKIRDGRHKADLARLILNEYFTEDRQVEGEGEFEAWEYKLNFNTNEPIIAIVLDHMIRFEHGEHKYIQVITSY